MHGMAIGQVLLDVGYLEDVMENEGDFVAGNSVYRFCSVRPNQSNKNEKITIKKSKIYGNNLVYLLNFVFNYCKLLFLSINAYFYRKTKFIWEL